MVTESQNAPYRVLARKYRPQNFDELIGQDALVRTLKNAIQSGRIAHAFMLTGVRGVGKTTTARIIARALNYTGPDGTAGPTTGPTDDCATCRAIAEDRHPDVMEMDAASRTGVDDIREILDGVRYAPVSARYKVYIIDEVHMLSKAAFNALLKTLEEPPPHVKFIFATTEIRKVPVTVLSRCQRFDLRRVDPAVLETHFKNICGKESVGFEDEAITAIARAADGSVRDGLSLLDQAIALGDGKVEAEKVSAMLGLADRMITFSLLKAATEGKPEEALGVLKQLHDAGSEPMAVVHDLLDLTHGLTIAKAAGPKAQLAVPHAAQNDARAMADRLSMPALQRIWSILLKSVHEIQSASNAAQALEMTVLRLIYAADLPDPARLIAMIGQDGIAALAAAPRGGAMETPSGGPMLRAVAGGNRGPVMMPAPQAQAVQSPEHDPMPVTLAEICALCEKRGEVLLSAQIEMHMSPVHIEPGRIEFAPVGDAPTNLAARLATGLSGWTGQRWIASISNATGGPTLAQQRQQKQADLRAAVLAQPAVIDIMAAFPGAEIRKIQPKEQN